MAWFLQGWPSAVLAVQVVIMGIVSRPGVVKKAAGWLCADGGVYRLLQ